MAKTTGNKGRLARPDDLADMTDEKLLKLRAQVDTEIRRRGLKFSVGEIGESLAIAHFNATKGLPKLLRAPRGTKNVDALSREGERYSIKTVLDAKKTGTIYPDPENKNKQLFEHLLIVRLTRSHELLAIHRLSWDQFVQVRQWDMRMSAWYVGLSKRLLTSISTTVTCLPPSESRDERPATQTTIGGQEERKAGGEAAAAT